MNIANEQSADAINFIIDQLGTFFDESIHEIKAKFIFNQKPEDKDRLFSDPSLISEYIDFVNCFRQDEMT